MFHVKQSEGHGTKTFSTPSASTRIELRVRNSRFIGIGDALGDAAGVKGRIEEIRDAHPGCSHVAYAFAVGRENSVQYGQSDDGEPKGTAGRPMLDVLKGHAVSNALIAAVRYFGGTKLGTGGLVRAYGATAKRILADLPLTPLEYTVKAGLFLSYEVHAHVEHLLADLEATVQDVSYGTGVEMLLEIPARRLEELRRLLREVSRGTARLHVLEDDSRMGEPREQDSQG